MSDEDDRKLEREARNGDAKALAWLTTARMKVRRGTVAAWVTKDGESSLGVPGEVDVTHGFEEALPVPGTRIWAVAALDVVATLLVARVVNRSVAVLDYDHNVGCVTEPGTLSTDWTLAKLIFQGNPPRPPEPFASLQRAMDALEVLDESHNVPSSREALDRLDFGVPVGVVEPVQLRVDRYPICGASPPCEMDCR